MPLLLLLNLALASGSPCGDYSLFSEEACPHLSFDWEEHEITFDVEDDDAHEALYFSLEDALLDARFAGEPRIDVCIVTSYHANDTVVDIRLPPLRGIRVVVPDGSDWEAVDYTRGSSGALEAGDPTTTSTHPGCPQPGTQVFTIQGLDAS